MLFEVKTKKIIARERIRPKYKPGIIPRRVIEKYCRGSRRNCKRERKPICIRKVKSIKNRQIAKRKELIHQKVTLSSAHETLKYRKL